MKTFNFKITADTSEITKQFENGAKAVRELALQAEKAEDKLEVLQETSNYIKQMDVALAKVKKKYPNLFQEIFGNVDKQINESLAPLKKMPEEMTKIFGKTKIKLDTLIVNPTAATVSDIQEIGNAFKLLAKTMGDTSLDFKFLDGSSKNETMIKKLTAAMKELERSYFNVGVAASAVNNEIKTPKIKTTKAKKDSGVIATPGTPDNIIKHNKEIVISYKEVVEAVTELNALSMDENAFDEYDEKLESLSKSLGIQFDKLAKFFTDFGGGNIEEVMNKLVSTFRDKIPSAVQNTSESISGNIGEATQTVVSGAEKIEDTYKKVEKTVKKTSEVIKDVLADASNTEKLMLVNTKNRTSSKYVGGNNSGVAPGKLIENYDGGKGFDATLHTHPNNVAAPSSWDPISKTSDFNVWIQNFEQFKKHFILAGEQLAEVDFSSLTKEQLKSLHEIYKTKADEIYEPEDIKINDAISLTYDMIPKIINQMKSNLESALSQNQNGNEQAINDAAQSYIQQIIQFFQNVDVGNLSYAEIEEQFDQIAIDILKQYPEDMRNKIKSTLSNSAFEAFGNVTGIEQVVSDQYQQLLQNAFIDSIKDVKLDPSKVFKLYDAKSFDFDTFTGKQLEIQDSSAALESATSDANELRTALEGAGQETRDLKAEAEAAKKAFGALTAEVNENWASMSDVDIGRSEKSLEDARNQLKQLAEQGLITAEAMDKFESEYSEAMHQLDMRKTSNKYDKEAAQDALKYGGYEDGYQDGYNNARNDYYEELDAYQNTIKELRQELAEAQNRITDGVRTDGAFSEESGAVKSNIQEEITQLDLLKQKLIEVEQAIKDKTAAFDVEKTSVDENIAVEIAKLEELKSELLEIANSIKNINDIKLNTATPKQDDKPLQGEQLVMDLDAAMKQDDQAVNNEISTLDILNSKIGEIITSINAKTEAFKIEDNTVDAVVAGEIAALDRLIAKLKEVKDAVDGKTDAFKQEGDTVDKETKKKSSGTKKKESKKETTDAKKDTNEDLQKELELTKKLAEQQGTLTHLRKQAEQAKKTLGSDIEAEKYEKLIALIDTYKKSKKELGQNEIDSIRQSVTELQQQAVKVAQERAAAEAKVNTELDEQITKLHEYYNQYEKNAKQSTVQEKIKLNIKNALKQVGGLNNPDPSIGITGTIAEFSGVDTFKRDYAKLAAYKEMLEQIGYTLSEPVFNQKDGILSAKIIPIDGKAITDLEQARQILEDIYINNKPISETSVSIEAQENEELERQIALTKELIKQQGTLNFLEKEAKESEKLISNTWNDGQAEQYEQLLVLIREYKKSKELLSEEELKYIRETVSGYQQQAKAIKEAKATEEKAKNAYGIKEITNASGRMDDAEAYGRQFNQSSKVQAQLETVRQVYNQLRIEQEKLANSTEAVTQEQENAFKDLVNTFGREYGNLKTIISESEKAVKNSKFKPIDVDPSIVSDANKLKEAMMQAIRSSEQGKIKFGKFNSELGIMEYQVKETAGQWSNFTAQLDASRTKIVGVQAGIKKTNTFLKDMVDSTLSKMKSAIANVTGYDLIYRVINEVKRGVTYVREIDSAMTELKKVTNETEATYARFLQTASKTADRIGSTVKDVTTMTADWSRLGYTLKEASSLAESTGILLNVSEFQDAEQASEALISTIQAYGYAADESMQVVDILNEVNFTCLLVW